MEIVELNKALSIVANAGDLQLLKFRIEKIPNVVTVDDNNCVFGKATKNGHLEILKYLISIVKDFPRIDPAADSK